jgi:hypothetical protein
MPSERKLKCFFVYENKGRINFRQGVAMQHLMVVVLIYSFVHIGCDFGTTILFLYS